MMGWYDDGTMGTGGWIAMIVMMSLFWGAVILAGVMIFRGSNNWRSAREGARDEGGGATNPMDILDERFARGEIEHEEYEARKTALSASRR